MKSDKTFGEIIKKLREDKQLTLREVAMGLNIDISLLGKIEKNNRKPNKKLIEKFAAYFNVSTKELMIAFLSDIVTYEVMEEEDFANEVLKAAERKENYLKT